MRALITCHKHPRYKAIRAPKPGCVLCHAMWQETLVARENAKLSHRCDECGWMKYPDAVEQIRPKTISTTLKRDHRESGMQVTEADKGGNSNHVSDGARQDARFVHPVSQWSPKTEEPT